MADRQPHLVFRFLRALWVPAGAADATDGQLLERFVARRDEGAFAALVRRHGPMVLAVCRRVLRDEDAAEDAFQATFLVLARRAGSVGRPGLLGNWLYGVACRTALKARAGAARRRAREGPLVDVPAGEAPPEALRQELRGVLDEELGRLPEKYRVPLVLCYLDGMSHEEAARVLGCPRETVSTRVARGREWLRGRLTRRGLALGAALFAAALAEGAAPAAVPETLGSFTVKAAAAGAAPPQVAALAEGVLKAMFWNKLTRIALVVLMLALLGGGTGVLVTYQLLAADPPKAAKDDKDKIQGTWVMASGEREDGPFPEDYVKDNQITFRGDKVTMKQKDEEHEASFKIDPSQKPKHFDLTISDKEGATGIYELEGDTLKLCLVEANGNDRPTEFKA